MTYTDSDWEYCQIDYNVQKWESLNRVDVNQKKLLWLQFRAEATEPNGRYIAARSERFPHLGETWAPQKDNQEHQFALAAFLDVLKAEDWELLSDRGSEWWHKKLRRPLSSPKRQRSVWQGIAEFFSK